MAADSVTMADVAARAGVSKKTVSAVVNGVGQVSDATRERVRAAVTDLGYLPNPVARRLSASRAGTITLALPHLGSGDLAVLASAVVRAAERSGVGVLLELTAGGPDGVVDHPGISDGLLLVPSTPEVVLPDHVPVVVLGDRPVRADVDTVLAPTADAIDTVVAELGALRPLVVVAQEDLPDPDTAWSPAARSPAGDPRTIGPSAIGRSADRSHAVRSPGVGPSAAGSRIVATVGSAGAGYDAVSSAVLDGVDCLVVVGTALAIGALHALADRGVAVPDDLRVVAVGGGVEAAYADPSLTTVGPDLDRMASLAVDRLLARVAGESSAPRHVTVPVVVTRRESA